MTEKRWKYGTVIRVDPTVATLVPQPDERRWMVVGVASTGKFPWTLMYLGPGGTEELSHWTSAFGFSRVEENE